MMRSDVFHKEAKKEFQIYLILNINRWAYGINCI